MSVISDDCREHLVDLFEPAAKLGAIADRHGLPGARDAQTIAVEIVAHAIGHVGKQQRTPSLLLDRGFTWDPL